MFLFPDSIACAKKYGEGPDADKYEEEGCRNMPRAQVFLNPIVKNCRTCGSQFEVSPATQQKLADQGKTFPTHCPDCLDKKRAGQYRACGDCGEQFFISELEQEQYEQKKLAPRVRCWACVEKKKGAAGK
jgi:hypothetical protein